MRESMTGISYLTHSASKCRGAAHPSTRFGPAFLSLRCFSPSSRFPQTPQGREPGDCFCSPSSFVRQISRSLLLPPRILLRQEHRRPRNHLTRPSPLIRPRQRIPSLPLDSSLLFASHPLCVLEGRWCGVLFPRIALQFWFRFGSDPVDRCCSTRQRCALY
ncbi:hypothetical protein ACQJBY_058959 [Aegilops geniculata]